MAWCSSRYTPLHYTLILMALYTQRWMNELTFIVNDKIVNWLILWDDWLNPLVCLLAACFMSFVWCQQLLFLHAWCSVCLSLMWCDPFSPLSFKFLCVMLLIHRYVIWCCIFLNWPYLCVTNCVPHKTSYICGQTISLWDWCRKNRYTWNKYKICIFFHSNPPQLSCTLYTHLKSHKPVTECIQRKCVSVSSHVPLDAFITLKSVTCEGRWIQGLADHHTAHCHLLGSASPSWQNKLICDSIWNVLPA